MRARFAVLAVSVAALTVAACGEREIDVKKSAKLIRDAIEVQVGAKVTAMSCPETVKVRARATFRCVVTAVDGTKGTAEVTQTDGKGTISVSAPFLHTGEAEQRVLADLRIRAPRATVKCPEIILARKGAKFECQANLGEFPATVLATQTDDHGTFTYHVRSG